MSSSIYSLNDSLDICFIHLNDVREISPDFISVGVSGMNDCDLLSCGRPYSILYRKSLSTCVIRLVYLTYLFVFTCLHVIVLIPIMSI